MIASFSQSVVTSLRKCAWSSCYVSRRGSDSPALIEARHPQVLPVDMSLEGWTDQEWVILNEMGVAKNRCRGLQHCVEGQPSL